MSVASVESGENGFVHHSVRALFCVGTETQHGHCDTVVELDSAAAFGHSDVGLWIIVESIFVL